MKDSDTEFTPEELAGIVAGCSLLEAQRQVFADGGVVGDGDDDRRVHYERVPIKGAIPRGGFRLPNDVVNRLGDGDPRVAGAVIARL
jgi:hypothetical protein